MAKKEEKDIYLKCNCGCSILVVTKTVWDDGEENYNFMIADSRYDHKHTTLFGRVKSAITILFGKPLYFNDVYIENRDGFNTFVEEIKKL